MIIQGAAVALASRHEAVARYSKRSKLTAWTGRPPGQGQEGAGAARDRAGASDSKEVAETTDRKKLDVNGLANALIRGKEFGIGHKDAVSLSPEALERAGRNRRSARAEAVQEVAAQSADELEMNLLQHMLEALTGRRMTLLSPLGLLENIDEKEAELEAAFGELREKIHALESQRHGVPPAQQGWGVSYDEVETYFESESTAFEAEGKVLTADGREIDFSVQLNMSRTFMERNETHIRAGDAILTDPLVLNFDAPAAKLTTTKFEFDLDADGDPESISSLRPGSGFLALDKNNDQVINDGNELFGPKSGDGFSDLAQYDSDGNQWIDEADPIFDQLRIWTKDPEGQDQLFALGEKGIGAIYLGNVDAPFSLKNDKNELQGEARGTGVFLKENGDVGIVQQVNLAARPVAASISDPGSGYAQAGVTTAHPKGVDLSV